MILRFFYLIYETGNPFCNFTIKLSEDVRIHRRTYTKLITILGDVGGLMEVVFTLFRLITSFSLDILYDISLVNNLFNFNLAQKVVILKDKKLKQNISAKDISQKVYISKRKFRILTTQLRNFATEENNIESLKRINEENKIDSNYETLIAKFAKTKQSRGKTYFLQLNEHFNSIFSFKIKI